MKGISTSKKNLCPICGNHHGCRIQEDKWVLCLRVTTQQDSPPGYRFVKPLRNGMGGLFVADDGDRFDDTWQDRIDRINQRRQQGREAVARLLSIEERDRQYRAVVSQLELSPQHIQIILNRGLNLAEIQQAGFRSWEPGKRVTDATSQLAGINSKGERLLGARGIFIPAYDSWGNITGAQLKTDSNRPGKYIWLSSYKTALLTGRNYLLVNYHVTFDWKAKKEVLGADGHYFSDSTRGTNEFISRTAIAAIGLPMPDVATFYDLWLSTKTNDSLSFDDFYHQLVDAEIIQEVGRLRANRRPKEKLTFYLIGDTEKCRVANYQPPTKLKPRRVEVRDLCPAAASKSQQAWLGICEFAKRWWSEHGELPTQKLVSEQTGIDRSWISKLAAQFVSGWKCLKKVIQSLVDPPYNRSNLIDSIPEDFEWLAKTYLPLVVQQPSLGVAQEMNNLIQACGWQGWLQVLSQTSQALRLSLIAALFRDAFS